LRLPFVVILTVPLGLIGAVGALWILGWPVGVLALIGGILLCGIVVNNGIIFVVRILQLRDRGFGRDEAARVAGLERLRPILITTTTTVLGLLPLALGVGAGAELRRPLAVTVIGGLVVATFLTLTVIPCGYRILARSDDRGPREEAAA
jgi:HAE1 family hydrophobic/amphiphilic exporter-1